MWHDGLDIRYSDDAGNLVICGDCLEVMKQMPDGKVDAIVTDPPFTFAGGISNGRTSIVGDQFFLHWWKDVCGYIEKVAKQDGEGFWWCDWKSAYTMSQGFQRDQKYTWRASQMLYHYREMIGMGRPFRSTVDMITYIRGPKSKGQRIPNNTENFLSQYWYYGKHEYHPAEKSPDVCMLLIGWCSGISDLVLDPFLGSGTTAVAALRQNRRFIGIELSSEYCDMAVERIKQELAQPDLFLAKEVNDGK